MAITRYNVFSVIFLAEIIRMVHADSSSSACQPISCHPPISKPNLKLTCGNRGFWLGTVCEAKCDPGFQLSGESQVVCKPQRELGTGLWESATKTLMTWDPKCLPKTCDAAQKMGLVRIHPEPYADDGIEVYCEDSQHVDGRWIVIQRRINGSVDFYRTYDEYVNGFGNKNKEFWFGLEQIHQLTAADEYDLLVELEDVDGNKTYETYEKFSLGDGSTMYTLHAENPEGSAGDAMKFSIGQKFTTYDRDNDICDDRNCAVNNHGAWWYDKCGYVNLNGKYYNNGKVGSKGITWKLWKNEYISLKSATIKIRKKKISK